VNTAEIIIKAHNEGLSRKDVTRVCIALGKKCTHLEGLGPIYDFEDGSILEVGETLLELPF